MADDPVRASTGRGNAHTREEQAAKLRLIVDTMYVDKPMRDHGPMQAIARVNQVYKDKPGGLVVDYIGIVEHLRQALASYTERDRGQAGTPRRPPSPSSATRASRP